MNMSIKARFLIAVLAMAGAESCHAQRAQIQDRLPFEVYMRVHWQGKDLELRKIHSCDLRRRTYPGDASDPGLKLREVWDQSTARTYFILPSKEVLVVGLPVVCNPRDKSLRALADGFLPVVYWIDNAESPREAEQVISHRYFVENEKRRFEIRKFSISAANVGVDKIDDDLRFVWLMASSARSDAYFAGALVTAIPRSTWGRFPGLATHLTDRTTSGPIDRALVEREAKDLLWVCQDGAQTGVGYAERCLTGAFDDRPYAVAASPLSEGRWRVDYRDVAVRRYSRHIDIAQLDTTGCNPSFRLCNEYKGSYRLELGEFSVEMPRSGANVIYDATRQMLLVVRFGFAASTFHYTNRATQ